MGHTINPISNRLRINTFWKSIWCSYTKINYRYLVLNDLNIYNFINWFIKTKFFKQAVFTIANWSLLFNDNKCIIIINYYPLKKKTLKFKLKLLKKRFKKLYFVRLRAKDTIKASTYIMPPSFFTEKNDKFRYRFLRRDEVCPALVRVVI